jgi:hypothetical protein
MEELKFASENEALQHLADLIGKSIKIAAKEVDEDALYEMKLYMDNEEDLYNKKNAIYKNLILKKLKGTYDSSLAPKAFLSLIQDGIEKYFKSFGKFELNNATKKALSEVLARDFEELYEDGELESLIPEKFKEN